MLGGTLTTSKSTCTVRQELRTAAIARVPSKPTHFDGRLLNKGANKRLRYSMQFKFDMCEDCDEAIHDTSQPLIKNATNYFNQLYASPDIAHKWMGLYGKWNKPEYRKRMIEYILGKDFESTKKVTRSLYHHMENILYGEIVAKRKKSSCFQYFHSLTCTRFV